MFCSFLRHFCNVSTEEIYNNRLLLCTGLNKLSSWFPAARVKDAEKQKPEKNHCKRLNLLNSFIPRGASDMLLLLNILLFLPLIHKMGALFFILFVCLFFWGVLSIVVFPLLLLPLTT